MRYIYLLLFLPVSTFSIGQVDGYKNNFYVSYSLGLRGSGDALIGSFGAGYTRVLKSRSIFKTNIQYSTTIGKGSDFDGIFFDGQKSTFISIASADNFYNPLGLLNNPSSGSISLDAKLFSSTDIEVSTGIGYNLIKADKSQFWATLSISALKAERHRPVIILDGVTLSNSNFVPNGTEVNLTSFIFTNYWDFGLRLDLTYKYLLSKNLSIVAGINNRTYLEGDIFWAYCDLGLNASF